MQSVTLIVGSRIWLFLDINMPAIGGKACLKNIKRDSKLKEIPVVIYSTSQNPKDREQCIRMVAVAFLRKTNRVTEANKILSQFFTNSRVSA